MLLFYTGLCCMMKQILIATHGKMASGIRYTLELVVGKMAEITTMDAYVNPEDDVEKMLQDYFSSHEGDRIFVFTDMMGGSVNQKMMRYADRPEVTLITGMNLPVLLQVALAGEDVSNQDLNSFVEAARQELQLITLEPVHDGKDMQNDALMKPGEQLSLIHILCILATYVAKYMTSWLCNGPMSAKTGIPQTLSVSEGVMLEKIMRPSQANTGLFIALVLVAGAIWLIYRSTLGYKFTTVGLNIHHAEYMGINARWTVIQGMMISGAFGGIAGAIESLGVYGYFLDNFSLNIANDGMLSSMIVWNDICLVPIMSFFVAALKAGALSMERFAGVPRSIVDTITAVFIIFATMETLFTFHKKKKEPKPAADASQKANKGGKQS